MGACIFMIFVGMASTVVNTIGAFPSSPTMDTSTAQGSYDVNTYIWIGGTIVTLTSVVILLISKATNLIGLVVFAGTFWTSWASILPIFDNFGFSDNVTGAAIILMLTFGMTVMFIGAIIGILAPGSTAMR